MYRMRYIGLSRTVLGFRETCFCDLHNARAQRQYLRKTNQITTMCGKKGGGGKTSGGGKSSGPTPAQVNHGNQLNPSHTQYWASRGLEAPSGSCRGEVAKALEQFKSQQKK